MIEELPDWNKTSGRRNMKKRYLIPLTCLSLLFPSSVMAKIPDYEATVDGCTNKNVFYISFQIEDGDGNTVNVVVNEDTYCVTSEEVTIRANPGENGRELDTLSPGTEVTRVAVCDNGWSRIQYTGAAGNLVLGYAPAEALTEEEAGIIHKSEGDSIFAEAVDEVTATKDESTGADYKVQVGTPNLVSSDAMLKSLGTFRITYYCPCSICCGPWADGITSTGITATTNYTIAVDPSVIPYGSQVVIDGQVYVAQDCGGAIQGNCIDVYVATHAESERKGVKYTEVYLIP
jgi:3D (Asp-Asp-Asp) domain-containing protein